MGRSGPSSGTLTSGEVHFETERSIITRIGSTHGARLIAAGIAFFLSFGILVLFWYSQVRSYYSPFSDEFSLFVNSAKQFHPVFSEWFLQGFSRYFVPYPEWSVSSTNFARPVANAEYYIGSMAFGAHWAWYLLSNYFIQSMLVASVLHFSLRHLRVSLATAIGIGLLCFVSPAFDNGALYSTSFAFDLLAALFVIVGLNQLLSGKLAIAWIFSAAALFTKETAFFAPFAAGIVSYCRSTQRGPRRLLVPSCFLLPYAAWVTLRAIAFHGAEGIYAVPVDSMTTYALRVLKEFLHWPIPFQSAIRTNAGPRPASLAMSTFVIMNLSFWVAVLYLSCKAMRPYDRPRNSLTLAGHPGADVSPTMQAMLIYCIGSIIILLLIPGLSPRFGATFVPLFALVLVLSLQTANKVPLRTLAYILLVVPPLMNVMGRVRRFSDDRAAAQTQWAMAADYVNKLARSTAPTVYVVDDLSGGFSSTESIRRFTGYHGQLVRVNDLISGNDCPIDLHVEIQKVSYGHLAVTSVLDSLCGGHAFLSSSMHYPIGGADLLRPSDGAKLIYHGVPAGTVRFLSATGKLSVDIMDPEPSSVLLVPDLGSKTYREVRLGQ